MTVTEAARGELMRAGLPLAASAQIVVTTLLSARAGVRCGHSAHHSSYYRSDLSTQTTTVHCHAAAGDWCDMSLHCKRWQSIPARGDHHQPGHETSNTVTSELLITLLLFATQLLLIANSKIVEKSTRKLHICGHGTRPLTRPPRLLATQHRGVTVWQ